VHHYLVLTFRDGEGSLKLASVTNCSCSFSLYCEIQNHMCIYFDTYFDWKGAVLKSMLSGCFMAIFLVSEVGHGIRKFYYNEDKAIKMVFSNSQTKLPCVSCDICMTDSTCVSFLNSL